MSLWHLYGKCRDCGAEATEPCRDDDDDRVADVVCETRSMLAQKPLKTRARRPGSAPRKPRQAAPRSTQRRDCVCGRPAQRGETHCGRRACRGDVVACFWCNALLSMHGRRTDVAMPCCGDAPCVRARKRIDTAQRRREVTT